MEKEIFGIPALLEYLLKEGVHSCILHGSAATGRLRPHSDIDIAIAGDREFSTETLAPHIKRIREQQIKSMLYEK